MLGIAEIATAAATTLAPYLPYLVKAGKLAGAKALEEISKKGADASWERARALWDKIQTGSSEKPDVERAAELVAVQPDDLTYQKVLAKSLTSRLNENPSLAQELLTLLGGERAVQEVLADHSSWVEDLTQELQGAGTQSVRATTESVIKGVKQIRKQ